MITVNLVRTQSNRNIGDTLKENDQPLTNTSDTAFPVMANLPIQEPAETPLDQDQARNNGNWARKGIQPAIQSLNDWSAMQKTIRTYPDRVKIRMREIERQFAIYRLAYTNINYKSVKVEDDILGVYNNILDTIPRLEVRTKKRPLFLYINSGLRDLYQAWDNLSSLQDALSRLLERGPRKLEFYNRMLIYRDEKRRIAIQRRQNESRINAAYESIKKALSFVDRQTQDEGPIAFGNEILTVEDAKKIWTSTIENLLSLRKSQSATTETIISQMRSLEEIIRDFPSLSKQVQRVGERFARVVAFHDLLVSSGKRVIPQPEIARSMVMMYEQLPEQWVAGNFQELKITLERIENFLNFYENTVELEVAVGERRRSGFTQGLAQSILPSTSGLSSMLGLARVLVAAIDQRDRFMAGHSEKVAELAMATGKKLNWNITDLEFLELAGLLHDIGKISIPETVLTKVKPLTEDEWKTIQLHPYYGAQIVKQVNTFSRIVPWIYHHQEHWDGGGYPDHLTKDEIPKAASIIGIAEAYTVMTTELPYHPAVNSLEALDLIKKDAGKQFDPTMVDAFSEAISDKNKEEESFPEGTIFLDE